MYIFFFAVIILGKKKVGSCTRNDSASCRGQKISDLHSEESYMFCTSCKKSHAFHNGQERVGTFFLEVKSHQTMDWQSTSNADSGVRSKERNMCLYVNCACAMSMELIPL